MKSRINSNWIRRGLAVLAVGASLWAVAGGRPAHGEEVKSAPDVVIYDGTYPGWPWIDRAPGGKLLCVWREGTRHAYSSVGKVMLSTSDDEGKTWSAARTIVDAPQIDDRNTAILALSDTEWLVSYNTYTSSGAGAAMTARTTDGGATWAESQPVNGSSSTSTWTWAAPVKLSSGALILPYYTGVQGGPYQSLAALSDDNGESWTSHTVPNAPGFAGNEWSVVEMPDNSLAGITRTDAPGWDWSLYLTKSADKGKSWSVPVKTNLRDTRSRSPSQIFLHDGKPWVVYDDARMVSVALATTDDPELVTWNVDDRLTAYQYLPDGSPIDDGGYPVSVSLGGDRRLIVDYFIDGDTRRIVGYYVTMHVPEPSTAALLVAGLIGLLVYTWRRRK